MLQLPLPQPLYFGASPVRFVNDLVLGVNAPQKFKLRKSEVFGDYINVGIVVPRD